MNRYLKIFQYEMLLTLNIIQFIPVDRSVPETNPEDDFFTVVDARSEVATLIKKVCYDGHYYATEYPSFDRIEPVNLVQNCHIQKGHDVLNYSTRNTTVNSRIKNL